MAYIFLDTSAFLKLYVTEKGSNWLQTFIATHQFAISELTLFESATALRRRYIEGTFTRRQASALYAKIYLERSNFDLVKLDAERQYNKFISLSFNLPPSLRIRALDALQLTAAGIAQDRANNFAPPVPFVFVSSDLQLLNVAQAQGFTVENPENYP